MLLFKNPTKSTIISRYEPFVKTHDIKLTAVQEHLKFCQLL